MEHEDNRGLLRGLQQLAAGSFPRTCPTCGRVYEDFDQFLRETLPLERHSGLKEVEEEESGIAVEVYRNCVCGSTLMDLAQDRRDESDEGRQRRERFEDLLQRLIRLGLERDTAHDELLKVMHGEPSSVIERMIER